MLDIRCDHDHAINNTDGIKFIILSNTDIINVIKIFNMIPYHGFYMSIPSILFADTIDNVDDMNNAINYNTDARNSKISIVLVLSNL